MFAAIHIPQLPLVARIHHGSDWDDHGPVLNDQPVVVLNLNDQNTPTDRQRAKAAVLHANSCAREQFDISEGMTTTQALARCPSELVIFGRRPDLENETHTALLDAAYDLSPDLENTAQGSVIIDLSSLPFATSSPDQWAHQSLTNTLARLTLPLHLGISSTPDLAMLASLTGHTHSSTYDPYSGTTSIRQPTLKPNEFAGQPIAKVLTMLDTCGINRDAAAEITELFPGWGLQSVADLTNLPRAGLADRLGSGGALLHDLLTGRYTRVLKLHRPSENLAQHNDLEFSITASEPLLFILGRMLGTLCARLESSHQHAAQLYIELAFDDPQQLPYHHSIRIPEPSSCRDRLLDALHYHLESFTARAPITGITLDAATTPRSAKQQQLFERALKDPSRFATTITKLEALLGKHRVGAPVRSDTHRPDHTSVLPWFMSSSQPAPTANAPQESAEATTGIPLRRIRPPRAISVATDQPAGSPHPRPTAILSGPVTGAIQAWRGPFLTSGHWWAPDDRWHQVEWDIEMNHQTHLRISNHPQGWQIDGIY